MNCLKKNEFKTDCYMDSPSLEILDILETFYHKRLKLALPKLIEHAVVIENEFENHPRCPMGISVFLKGFAHEVCLHMNKEEMLVFPMIRNLLNDKPSMNLAVVIDDDKWLCGELDYLRTIAFDYLPPVDAGESWTAFYRDLYEFETELMEHIHLETDILYSRLLKL